MADDTPVPDSLPQDDVEMGVDVPIDADEADHNDAADHDAAENAAAASQLPSTDAADTAPVVSFLECAPPTPSAPAPTDLTSYLKSPIVHLSIGAAPEHTNLAAHQALLVRSPWFAQACAALPANRTIALPDDDLDAVGCVLEYLYNGDYFPKRQPNGALERDPRFASPDPTGDALLRHARVYTLAEKLALPALKQLAHSKIQNTTSTARGEIIYARYVYDKTAPDDRTIRNPVAHFWAIRSHKLRHEAEDDFRNMCIDFPQFGFDVLTRVLDHKERSVGGGPAANLGATPGSGRKPKRPRMSVGGT